LAVGADILGVPAGWRREKIQVKPVLGVKNRRGPGKAIGAAGGQVHDMVLGDKLLDLRPAKRDFFRHPPTLFKLLSVLTFQGVSARGAAGRKACR
jgi:hypothetical protein